MRLAEPVEVDPLDGVPVPLGESRQLELEPGAHGRDEPDPGAVEPPECERQRP